MSKTYTYPKGYGHGHGYGNGNGYHGHGYGYGYQGYQGNGYQGYQGYGDGGDGYGDGDGYGTGKGHGGFRPARESVGGDAWQLTGHVPLATWFWRPDGTPRNWITSVSLKLYPSGIPIA